MPKAGAARNLVSKLGKPGVLLPVILLEATVTLGRTYQAYKRDGFVEARERITEESLAAVFWLGGATMFNKLFDFLGKTFLNMPKEKVDAGLDDVRKPINNLVAEKGYNKKRLANFKVGKIAASIVAACAFVGIVVPKVNQAITKHLYNKQSKQTEPKNAAITDIQNQTQPEKDKAQAASQAVTINAVESFMSKNKDTKNPLSFKAVFTPDALLRLANNFENSHVHKLLGTDVGILTGRTYNARNNDERIEIMFRDISSIYFYLLCTKHVVKLLSSADRKNTSLLPTAALQANNHLAEAIIQKAKGLNEIEAMTPEAFREFALGKKQMDSKDMNFINGLFESEKQTVIKLSEYEEAITTRFGSTTEANRLKALGRGMSELQPEVASKKIITKTQIQDIFTGGEARSPEFMKKVLGDLYNTKERKSGKIINRLTDRHVFIPQEDIEKSRRKAINYVESIIEHAEKSGKDTKIDLNLMKKVNNKNLRQNGIYQVIGLSVSALFLSTIIPKVQYWITKKRTGQDGFPGIKDLKSPKEKSVTP